MRIIKFAMSFAAIVCLGALGLSAEEASSKKPSTSSKNRSASDSGTRKSSTSKKSVKARKSIKGKSRQAGAKSKEKSERGHSKAAASQDWIEELPPEELPELNGQPEDESVAPVSGSEP